MSSKSKKKLLSMLLSMVLLVSGIPISTQAAPYKADNTISENNTTNETENSTEQESVYYESTSAQTAAENLSSSESTVEGSETSSDESFAEDYFTNESSTEEIFSDESSIEEEQTKETLTNASVSTETAETEIDTVETETTELETIELETTEIETTEIETAKIETTAIEMTEIETTEIETTEIETTEIDAKLLNGFSDKETVFSEIFINPLYEDIIDKEDAEAELLSIRQSIQDQPSQIQFNASASEKYNTIEAAAVYVREQMCLRENSISFSVPANLTQNESFLKNLLDIAMVHTASGSGQEGDSLKFGYKGSQMAWSSDGTTAQITLTITYYTTLEQEEQLTAAVNSALKGLNLSEKTEHEKIKAIYNYICDHVDYDYDNLEDANNFIKYTAYAALCDGKAVCQGYAVLFYRMCIDAGLSARVISGIGNGGRHAWNIVKVNEKYYNVDCTWDGQDAQTTQNWFLLNETDFANHTRDSEYETSTFHSSYPMAEQSYGVENDAALNLDNLDATYTALDGSTISSKANGKPKLLVFFSTTCGNCKYTMNNISNNIKDFAGVDICAIETTKSSLDIVAQFKADYGCDEILFSYDTGTTNVNSMWKYAQKIGSNTISWPVICYIDANNKLQHITQSLKSAQAILSDLKDYCNYTNTTPAQQYTITYVLDGGTNNRENPSSYTSDMDTIVLKEPVKSGYTFDGWYTDAAYTTKVTSIEKGSTGDITLYAKWNDAASSEPIPTVEIKASDGNVVVGLNGSYYTETEDKILNRLNEIRLEACKEGVINPATGKPLTEADYRPLKWSSDLEAIARIRAAEATLFHAHTRPNGTSCFSAVTINGIQSWAENLAWGNGLMQGIEQWYEEKSAWVNNTPNEVTGHYQSLISTRYTYVGIGTFRMASGGWYTVAQEFSDAVSMASDKNASSGPCIQDIEVQKSKITEITLGSEDTLTIANGSTYTLPVELTVKYNIQSTGPFKEGALFTSSDENVATIDSSGVITAKSEGTTTITATAGEVSNAVTVSVYGKGDISLETGATISVRNDTFVYNGAEHCPKVTVEHNGMILKENQDYLLDYQNNINAGTATVTAKGMGSYQGSLNAEFTIAPAKLTIKAKDIQLPLNSKIPAYEYSTEGLIEGDKLLKTPDFTCNITTTATPGKYTIIPSNADAGPNYTISYENGTLIVAEETVSYTVTFDTQGHGEPPQEYAGILAGTTITQPNPPVAEGYIFNGWYKEATCKNQWDFSSDIVQSDIVLYAQWLKTSSSGFLIQEIPDVYYTGKACKPQVRVYDGATLLKVNKDYKISYKNNTAANVNGIKKQGNGTGASFNEKLPYVIITGKGNYKDTIQINFNILPAQISTGNNTPAAGVTLKYSDQLEASKQNALKPFKSIKFLGTMKQGKDFELSVEAANAYDVEGNNILKGTIMDNAAIPKGYTGSFQMRIIGKGNYTGSIEKTVYVADKTKLIKNAKITLGTNLKKIVFNNAPVVLTPSETNSKDTFTVQCAGKILTYQRDYLVSYSNNDSVGTAKLIITGINEYSGSKTTTFQIIGKPFNAKKISIEGWETNMDYAGKALTQNKVHLTYNNGTEKIPLTYGMHYTISYSKNINKGTATATFTGIKNAGYSGSFKKNFKIKPVDIARVTQAAQMKNISTAYTKAGAKPSEQIALFLSKNMPLTEGKDYTVSYQNNKKVANASDANPPLLIIKGKGNYTGKIQPIPFTITQGALDSSQISIITVPMPYNKNKSADFAYKPTVKVTEGKKQLIAGKDYIITYEKNTQADFEAYLQKLAAKNATENDMPKAVITQADNSNYKLTDKITIPLPVYNEKLTKALLKVDIDEAIYTGAQVTPKVTVSFNGKPLVAGTDYSISYGTNIKAGKNKGTIIISGISPYYGGSVTVKFNILEKRVNW